MCSAKARRTIVRRAFSLLELMTVVGMFCVIALSAMTVLRNDSLANVGAEGLARKLSLALVHARRSTITTADKHYLQMTPATRNV